MKKMLFWFITTLVFTGCLRPITVNGSVNKVIYSSSLPPLADTFTMEVNLWTEEIVRWSEEYSNKEVEVDPLMVATLMQVTSCGSQFSVDPSFGNPALKPQGLFLVVPAYHLDNEDDPFNPEVNAEAALSYFAELLTISKGDFRMAFAGYVEGPDSARHEDHWGEATTALADFANHIYQDAQDNVPFDESQAMNNWMKAHGNSLCLESMR